MEKDKIMKVISKDSHLCTCSRADVHLLVRIGEQLGPGQGVVLTPHESKQSICIQFPHLYYKTFVPVASSLARFTDLLAQISFHKFLRVANLFTCFNAVFTLSACLGDVDVIQTFLQTAMNLLQKEKYYCIQRSLFHR